MSKQRVVYEEDYKEIPKILLYKERLCELILCFDILMESFNEGGFVSKRPLVYWFGQKAVQSARVLKHLSHFTVAYKLNFLLLAGLL